MILVLLLRGIVSKEGKEEKCNNEAMNNFMRNSYRYAIRRYELIGETLSSMSMEIVSKNHFKISRVDTEIQ